MNDHFIGTKEAAKIIGVHQTHVVRMIRAGLFETVRRTSDKPKANYLLDLEEVERAKHIYRKLRARGYCGRRPSFEQAEATK